LTEPTPAVLPERVQPPVESRLVLLSELSPAEMLAPRSALVSGELPAGVDAMPDEFTPAESAEGPAAVASCYRVGDFADKKSASRTKAMLDRAGAETKGPVGEVMERTRYWVLLPAAPSRKQALAVVEKLKRAGVKDYYLIPSGENVNALSLGVFSSREAARRRMADVAGLKLKVRVEEVKYRSQRFALDVRWLATDPPAWNTLLPRGIEAKLRECRVSP
jgi:hypothetical protein